LSAPRDLDRLAKVELDMSDQRARLVGLAEGLAALRLQVGEAERRLTDLISPIHVAVMGSAEGDSPGLRERVRMLERADQNRRWVLGLILSAIIALSAKAVFDWIGSVNRLQHHGPAVQESEG
jgi:hypothetical protein